MARPGRPRKYNKKTLEAATRRYFASITRIVTVTELVETGERDSHGHKIYEKRAIINSLGEEARVEEYIVPPTVGGLCRFLGIHRSTWAEYCDREEHPEFSDTTTYAQGRMRGYLEQQLLTRKDVKGVIFDLQNNYGYSEKRQVELGDRAAKAVSAGSMSMSEKKAVLEQIAREFGGGGDSDGEPNA